MSTVVVLGLCALALAGVGVAGWLLLGKKGQAAVQQRADQLVKEASGDVSGALEKATKGGELKVAQALKDMKDKAEKAKAKV